MQMMKLAPRIVFALAAMTAIACHAEEVAVASAERPLSEAEATEFFEREVRPILVQRCQECHGTSTQKGGLRLDSREAIIAGGDTGPAVEPGKPDESLLVDAIRYGDSYQMPPKSQLPQAEIDALTRWVQLGAPWPAGDSEHVAQASAEFNLAERAKHWAFQPLQSVQPPEVQDANWPRTPLDAFILAQLEAHGLTPTGPTDKRSWLRRVTFDLTGLPPTRDELAAFLADDSSLAYTTVVDRLLASPHYGERWARHWLDLVRYAETYGHEFDFDIPHAFRYRDYLIRAFNADVPYDQLVLEHIAGDLLPAPRVNSAERWNESIMGTGFFWLGEAKHSPVDARQDEAERIDNQIDVLAKTFLGLTVSCARCHDHKFDPISTKDYYALAGYLQSSRYQQAFIDLPEVFEPVLHELAGQRAAEQASLQDLLTQSASADLAAVLFARWTTDESLQLARDQKEHPLHVYSVLMATAAKEFGARKSELAAGFAAMRARNEPADCELFGFEEGRSGWFVTGQAFGERTARVGELLLARLGEGNVVRLVPAPAAHSGLLADKLQGALRSPTFTIEQPKLCYRLYGTGGRVRLIVDGLQLIQDPIYGGLQFAPHSTQPYWHVQDVSKWIGHRAYIELIDDGDGFVALERVVATDDGAPSEPPLQLVVSALADPEVDSRDALRARYVELVRQACDPTKHDTEMLRFAGPVLERLAEAVAENATLAMLATRRREIEGRIPMPRQASAMADGTGENERVFIRGNHKQLGEEVVRRNLEVLSGPRQPAPSEGSGRAELARRLLDDSGHLLARVMVNRVWRHHFGEGLVRTPDDFGAMGQQPSHPELLDYLAAEFRREGWSLKRLHRHMVLSSTYRMSSAATPRDEIDPNNRWWHRMPVRRLEAECVRDAMLAVSGRLDRAMFGASVPPHLTEFMQGRGRPAQSGPADGAGRRSIYLAVRRNFLSPFLLAFDYPTPFTTIGRRSVSNVPAQALVLLNNPLVHEQAAQWAARMLVAVPASDLERLQAMYEEALARPATADEAEAALAFVRELRAASGNERAWTELGHVLFNLKEFVFVR